MRNSPSGIQVMFSAGARRGVSMPVIVDPRAFGYEVYLTLTLSMLPLKGNGARS